MASCAAKGCKNYRRKSKGVTFFSLPKHPSLAAEWLQRINKDRLPKHICVCEKHFSDKQFNNSTEMRNKFLVECGQKRKARKLIPNAVPDIFLQNEKESNTKNVVLDVLKDTPQLNENTPQIVPSQLNLLQESNFNFQEYPSQVEFKMKVHYEIEETLNAYSELPNDQEDSYFFHDLTPIKRYFRSYRKTKLLRKQ